MKILKVKPVVLILLAMVLIGIWLFRSATGDKVKVERALLMRNMRDMQLLSQ